jgi:hypothetical protein
MSWKNPLLLPLVGLLGCDDDDYHITTDGFCEPVIEEVSAVDLPEDLDTEAIEAACGTRLAAGTWEDGVAESLSITLAPTGNWFRYTFPETCAAEGEVEYLGEADVTVDSTTDRIDIAWTTNALSERESWGRSEWLDEDDAASLLSTLVRPVGDRVTFGFEWRTDLPSVEGEVSIPLGDGSDRTITLLAFTSG